ncbi:MAG: glycosyltransferase family 2 protein [Nitrospiraceae bacterium]|nr:glycosyltransferase family 2 protein [Nitrospiraceae bacterium]
MIPLSVVIITKNEEKNIADALESVRDAAEIVIFDSFSTDKTLEICKKYTDKIFQKEWQGYAKQKQSAVDIAKNRWVLILDADERVTAELKNEIKNAIENDGFDGFYLPRKNFFLGKWIKHSGWWPDYTLRVFKKDSGHMEEREVHEKIILNGSAAYLKNHLEHYTYTSISEFIKKMDNYSSLSAREMEKNGVSAGIFDLTIKPLATFIKMFFIRMGFMDGLHGLILAVFYSYYTFLKYAKTWEMSKK